MEPRLAAGSALPYFPSSPDPECALIRLEGVTKVFKTGAGEFTALKDIDLCFGEGEFVSIMGKSGSGKSTLINMMTGIDHPTRGRVRVGDVDIHHMSEGKLAVWRGRTMGIVFQFFQLLPMLTVLENTMLPMDFCEMYPLDERPRRAMALLEKVGLREEADKLPAALSGGQQQVAAVARALANDPPILAADEPTGNLDTRAAERILDIFSELADQGKTILIVTHDPSLAQRATRRVLISDGELIHPAVAQALPLLSHPQMLAITKQVILQVYQPGESIPNPRNGLSILSHGQVDVSQPGFRHASRRVGTLQPGEAFGELDPEASKADDFIFQVSDHSLAEVLWLRSEAWRPLLAGAHLQGNALQQLAWSRRQQYRGGNPTKGRRP